MPKKNISKPRPVGRPAKPKNERHTKQITVRLTVEEMKNLETAAHDQLVAKIAREMLLDAAKRKNKRLTKKTA